MTERIHVELVFEIAADKDDLEVLAHGAELAQEWVLSHAFSPCNVTSVQLRRSGSMVKGEESLTLLECQLNIAVG